MHGNPKISYKLRFVDCEDLQVQAVIPTQIMKAIHNRDLLTKYEGKNEIMKDEMAQRLYIRLLDV